MRTAPCRRSRTTVVIRRRREPVRRRCGGTCCSRRRGRRPRFRRRRGFLRVAARKTLNEDERRVLERGVVVLEFGAARVLDLVVHGDVRRRVVVPGVKVGRVDVEAGLSCDGALGKDGVEGGDVEGAGPVTRRVSISTCSSIGRGGDGCARVGGASEADRGGCLVCDAEVVSLEPLISAVHCVSAQSSQSGSFGRAS